MYQFNKVTIKNDWIYFLNIYAEIFFTIILCYKHLQKRKEREHITSCHIEKKIFQVYCLTLCVMIDRSATHLFQLSF